MNKATELIQNEHRLVESLFSQFEASGDRDVALAVCDLLDRHAEMEEEILYPALQEVDEELYEDAQQEHDEARELIGQIRHADGDELVELVSELKAAISHHVEDEETDDLPAMVEACGTERMDQLGEEMDRWRTARAEGSASVAAAQLDDAPYVSNGAPDGFEPEYADGPAASSKEALLDLTKDELYEKAKDADVAGRSNMNKDELAAELADH